MTGQTLALCAVQADNHDIVEEALKSLTQYHQTLLAIVQASGAKAVAGAPLVAAAAAAAAAYFTSLSERDYTYVGSLQCLY